MFILVNFIVKMKHAKHDNDNSGLRSSVKLDIGQIVPIWTCRNVVVFKVFYVLYGFVLQHSSSQLERMWF